MPDSHQAQIESLGRAALARPAAERAAFLRAATAEDRALQAAVEAWMAAQFAEAPTRTADAPLPGLRVGQRIGPYEVQSLLGMGGMGVVYKAADTRLHRPVAIKVIRDDLAGDRAALWAEARAIAGLDHPYICKIYDVIDGGDGTLAVMEFVDGETLAARIARGPLPVADALRLGLEMAEGLADAHARGLVHRDVKPSNVMVTPHGHVKLLDFGLARPGVERPPAATTRLAATVTHPHAGTPMFMAPEQALGQPLTPRVDVFSLGVVLFNMLTGTLPFEGASAADYLRALSSTTPKPLASLAPGAPADLARLVDRCLQKDPAARPASAADVAQELRGILEPRAAAMARTSRWTMAAGVLVVAVVAAGGMYWWTARGVRPIARRSEAVITWPNNQHQSRVSPDGEWLAFVSDRSGTPALYVEPASGGEARLVAVGDGTVVSDVWSPDATRLAGIVQANGAYSLRIVEPFSASPPLAAVTLHASAVPVTRALRWIGSTVYYDAADGYALRAVDVSTGADRDVLAAWHVTGRPRSFDVRPDGRRVVYEVLDAGREDLWTANLDGSDARRLTDDAFFERDPLWVGDGQTILYQSNRGGQADLWEMPAAGGAPWQLTTSEASEVPDSSSASGALISFSRSDEHATLWRVAPGGASERPLTADALSDLAPSTSAGAAVVFQRAQSLVAEGYDVFDATVMAGTVGAAGLMESVRSVADGFGASLSPDATWIAYRQRVPDDPKHVALFVKSLMSGEVVKVTAHGLLPEFTSTPLPPDVPRHELAWAGDDTLFYVDDLRGLAGGQAFAVGRFDTRKGQVGQAVVTLPAGIDALHDLYLSGDGGRLAFQTSQHGVRTVHVVGLAGQASVASSLPGQAPAGDWLLLGWAGGDLVVLHGMLASGADLAADAELYAIALDGARRSLGRLDRTLPFTARLDGPRGLVYVTRVEDGVANVYAWPIRGGAARQLTHNQLPNVTFAGLTPLADGALMAVRDEREREIWVMRSGVGPGAPLP